MNEIEIKKINFDFIKNITIDKEKEEEVIKYEQLLEKKQREQAFINCGIGEVYQKYDFDNFEQENEIQKMMVSRARDYYSKVVKGENTNLICCGDSGTGKTKLMISLLKIFNSKVKSLIYGLKDYYSCKYVTSKALTDRFQQAESFSASESKTRILKDMLNCDVLVIDEIGKGDKKIEPECLFAILDIRYQNRKTTMLGTNMSYKDLSKFLGSATLSRLNTNAGLIVIETYGLEDLRQKKRA